MHGLVHRAVQCFVVDTYGAETWLDVARLAELEFAEFEAMLTYDDEALYRVLAVTAEMLNRPETDLKEDLGTYLISSPDMQSLRRLLRFGGETFFEFLHSLDDLQDRARLAVSDFEIPSIDVLEHDLQNMTLRCEGQIAGFGHVLMGVLRAMADDYGALVLLEHHGESNGVETLSVSVVESCFAEGRSFQLGAPAQ